MKMSLVRLYFPPNEVRTKEAPIADIIVSHRPEIDPCEVVRAEYVIPKNVSKFEVRETFAGFCRQVGGDLTLPRAAQRDQNDLLAGVKPKVQ